MLRFVLAAMLMVAFPALAQHPGQPNEWQRLREQDRRLEQERERRNLDSQRWRDVEQRRQIEEQRRRALDEQRRRDEQQRRRLELDRPQAPR